MISSENLTGSLQEKFNDPSLVVLIKPDWGSQNPQHRDEMKKELAAHPSFTDQNYYSSISHCEGVGIAVASKNPIGVDVEMTARVSEPVIARISSPAELDQAPGPSSLWCAKEASFKALKTFNQPSVLSHISIGDWANIDSQFETYRLINALDFNASTLNRGVVIKSSPHTYSFFLFFS